MEADEICASCGITPVDDIKLKECDGCDLVKYCSDKCREEHREPHEEDCKKRKAELRDKELFEQPEKTCYGECPICFIPMPLDLQKSSFYSCCCKFVCDGCVVADYKNSGNTNCPFCREPTVNGDENEKRILERVKVNDPNALRQMGGNHYGEGNRDEAIGYLEKAAELVDARACYLLGCMYYFGEGVEKNEEKGISLMRRRPLEVIPTLDTILHAMRRKMVKLKEQ